MRNQLARPSLLLTSAALVLIAGCGAPSGGSSSACNEAAAYLASCEGGSPAAVGSCDNVQAAAAESVMSQSCEALTSGESKSDAADAICIALVIPLFVTGIQPGGMCCYGYQCAGSGNTCIDHRCGPRRAAGGACG